MQDVSLTHFNGLHRMGAAGTEAHTVLGCPTYTVSQHQGKHRTHWGLKHLVLLQQIPTRTPQEQGSTQHYGSHVQCLHYSQLTQRLPNVREKPESTKKRNTPRFQAVVISGAFPSAKIHQHPCCSKSRKQQLDQDLPLLCYLPM